MVPLFAYVVLTDTIQSGASTPLIGGGKWLIEKVGGSKKLKTGREDFLDGKLPKIPKYA